MPVDKRELSKGWVTLEIPEQDILDGKAKGGKRKVGGKNSVFNESPAGAGLGDGSILAFRFRRMKDDDEERDEDSMEIEADPGWDVVLPIFEDEGE